MLATDHPGTAIPADSPPPWALHVPLDLSRLASEPTLLETLRSRILPLLGSSGLHCLINNAAIQRLAPVAALTLTDWSRTLQVNVLAPFLLSQSLTPLLSVARGCILNVTSIHAQLTKPGFAAYASSKAALEGLTRALAVELAPHVRVNAIRPAALSTPMLEAGFTSHPEARAALDDHHPAGRIGTPLELARLALWLAADAPPFLTGAVIGLDGAIGSRLHDPAP